MKRLMKRKTIAVILLAAIFVMAMPVFVFAAEDAHTVTYIIDGEAVSTQEVAHGGDAVAPEIPAKFGYTQIPPQWGSDGKNITEDTTIEAEYTLNEYVVTYKVDGESYKSLTFLHGEQVVMIPVPEKEGYTAAWDTVIDVLTDDITVNAVYTEITVQDTTPNPSQRPSEEWDNSENEKWAPIILGAMAGLVLLFVLLRKLKKKNDQANS